MAKISACIISFDEEKKIEDCLASLAGVADEIVVVDSGSRDRTVEIAERLGARVIRQDFLGHVAQKNLAVEHAKHDWILSLDCDERLTPELARSIQAVKDALGPEPAFEVARRTFYVYRFLDHMWYPEWRVRLFDRRRCRWGGVDPHDKVIVTEDTAATLSGDLLHYSFDSLSDHLRTIDSFTEIAARELIQRGVRVSWWTPPLRGLWTFFRYYVLRRGFLDGAAGLCASVLSFVHVYVKYARVWLHGCRTQDVPQASRSPEPAAAVRPELER